MALKSDETLHFHGALGSKVGFEDFLEALSGVDVDSECLRSSEKVGFGI